MLGAQRPLSRRTRPVLLAAALIAFALSLAGVAAPGRAASRRADARHAPRSHSRPASLLGECPNAGVPAGTLNLSAMRAAVLCLVNQQRSARGLPALSEDGRLDRSAQGWTTSMVAQAIFTHGANFAARISAAGFDWSQAGENIATGYATPAAVLKGWMASTGHCRNLLDPAYSSLGIGMVPAAVRGFASGPATWTQDFALPMGKRAPSRNRVPADGCPY